LDSNDIIGDAYEYMIANFASDAGKKGGEFFTPSRVSELVAKLVQPRENDRIYDATCGSGGLLLKAHHEAGTTRVAIYGQECNAQTWALCKMNMFLHNVPDATIWQGDTLANPQNIQDDKLMKFQVIVANPPFSLDKWDSGFLPDEKTKMSAGLDPWKRFEWGIPPVSKGDYAFVCHMLHCLDDSTGRMGIVLPHGVLFRGAQEGKIRRTIIENFNLLDAVIGLPANLFFGAGIPACILVFKKNRPTRNIFFIDASGEGNYEKGKNQNILREQDIEKIVTTYRTRAVIDKYSHDATFDEIRENDFNLNIPRYVDTFEEEPDVDITAVKAEIVSIEAELAGVQAQMARYLKELGV
jgi:type I restriction enzyme M protein